MPAAFEEPDFDDQMPATAILEVAVHKTFRGLDTQPHVLTSARVREPDDIFVVRPESVPNSNWLRLGVTAAGQQAFGVELLARYRFAVIPSAVSSHSGNLLFDATRASDAYTLLNQERFVLDTRLHSAA